MGGALADDSSRQPCARHGRLRTVSCAAAGRFRSRSGGSPPRDELERTLPDVPGRRPGVFVVDLDGAMIGLVTLDRRDARRPGRAGGDAPDTELGYLFLPEAWGRGYAAEACAAALDWFTGVLPGEPLALLTRTANARSMRLAAKLGFTELERFEEYGGEQWSGVWPPGAPSS
ncbi:GNAT family N-acetyltransferase [Streptomyces sp. CA-252508]|uniref:GNAT family N-acetyltransferase n=1 Tax=Streptomyces sp. CA-252508 TaxID=3418946 RepID=UPI003D8AD324